MIYIGTRKQKKMIIDIVEEIETDLAYEEDDFALKTLTQRRDRLVDIITHGIGIVRLPQ